MTGAQLKKTRLPLTQQKLADLLGVQPSKVCEWETGKRKIPKYITKLIDCLKQAGKL